MRFSLKTLVKYFVFQYHYISISLPLLFLLCYTFVASSDVLQFLFQLRGQPCHSHITLLPFITLFYWFFHVQTHDLIPVLRICPTHLPPTLSAQFYLSKSISCTIWCTYSFLTKSTMNLIYLFPCFIQSPHLNSIHNI
jgi:hypothetical protein